MKTLKILLTTIIWPITQYCYIAEVHFAWHKTEIKTIAEIVLVNFSQWTPTHTLHLTICSPLSYTISERNGEILSITAKRYCRRNTGCPVHNNPHSARALICPGFTQ